MLKLYVKLTNFRKNETKATFDARSSLPDPCVRDTSIELKIRLSKTFSFFFRDFGEDDVEDIRPTGSLTDQKRQCTVQILGMTCQSCVKNIETTIAQKPGVDGVKVDLAGQRGQFDYNPNLTSPDLIVEYISEMGFEASLDFGPGSIPQRGHIRVEGMTCQSCVKNIESRIGQVQGVKLIQVSLEEKLATVEFDTPLNVEILAESISDMGFETLPLQSEDIGIEGMTCQSCVKSIQDGLIKTPGVHGVKVDLDTRTGHFIFDPKTISVPQISEAVEDMGFETHVRPGAAADLGAKPKSKVNKDLAVPESKETQSIEMDYEKCFLRVQGMTCASCVAAIEKHVKKLRGKLELLRCITSKL